MSKLPKDWEYQQISKFIPDKKGAVKIGPFGSQLKSDEMVKSGIKVLGQENIIANDFTLGDRYISKEKYEKLKSCTVYPGDILVSMMGTIGLSREVPPNYPTAIMDSHLLRIQVDPKKVCKDYFCKILHEYEEIKSQLNRMSQGGIMSGLNSQIIHSLKFPIPPLNEQKKIAEILTSVDKVIELTEIEIEKLKNLKKGMMQDLLTKGIGHTKFKDSPIGKIPESWECLNFNDAKVKIEDGDRGTNYPKSEDFFDHEHCLFLSATNVTSKGFVFEKKQFITKEKDALLRKGKLFRGDVVLTTRGTVGNIAFYDNLVPFEHIRINSGMVILRNNSRKILNEFLYISFKEYSFNKEFQKVVSGSAQPQLPITDLKKFHLLIPPKDEQQKIIDSYNAINGKLNLKIKKFEKIQEMKKGLMQDLLTGKVRVKV